MITSDKFSEIFPEINLARMEMLAQSWVKKYPAIKKITLFPGTYNRYPYILIVEPPGISDWTAR